MGEQLSKSEDKNLKTLTKLIRLHTHPLLSPVGALTTELSEPIEANISAEKI